MARDDGVIRSLPLRPRHARVEFFPLPTDRVEFFPEPGKKSPRARRRLRPAFAALVVATTALAGCGDDTGTSVAPTAAVAPQGAPAPMVIEAPTSAVATTTALRVDPPLTECQRIAAAVGGNHTAADQLLIVRTAAHNDTTAIVQLAERTGQAWICGEEMAGRVGRSGVRPLLERRSGDGTTPAGVFPLGTMTAWDGEVFSFFGNAADPGVTAGPYRRVRTGDCFGATPGTAGYGHLRYQPGCPGPDDEYLPRFVGAYVHAALIGANTEPDVSGDAPGEIPYASAIFLHRHSYDASGASKPTSGCVSLAFGDLFGVLRAMRPGALFAIGTTDSLLTGG